MWQVGVGLFLVALAWLAVRLPYWSADSVLVVQSGRALAQCLEQGVWQCPQVSPFPPLQTVLAAAAVRLGASDSEAYNGLAALNFAAFIGVLILVWAHFAGRGRAYLLVAVLIGSYSVNYSVTAFGEMLAVFLGSWLVVSVQRRRWVQASAAILLCSLTKDFAAPLLWLLALAALPTNDVQPRRAWLRQSVGPALLLGVSAAVGLMAMMAFNVLRFGVITNTHNLNPQLRVHSLEQQLRHVLVLFFSPNGGLALVAPVGLVLLVLAAIQAVRSWSALTGPQRLAPLAFTLLVSFGLAAWFTPLGWWAWGARLSLPWFIPAVVLAAAVVPAGGLERRGWWALALAPMAVVNTAHLFGAGLAYQYFERHVCSDLGTDAFFECLHGLHFEVADGLVAHVLGGLAQPMAWPLALLQVAVVTSALVLWLKSPPLDASADARSAPT